MEAIEAFHSLRYYHGSPLGVFYCDLDLTCMTQERSRVLIVDITGVPVVDTMVANHLIRMSDAVRLMGGESILTGIDLSNLNTRGTLAQGLELAMELVNKGSKES